MRTPLIPIPNFSNERRSLEPQSVHRNNLNCKLEDGVDRSVDETNSSAPAPSVLKPHISDAVPSCSENGRDTASFESPGFLSEQPLVQFRGRKKRKMGRIRFREAKSKERAELAWHACLGGAMGLDEQVVLR